MENFFNAIGSGMGGAWQIVSNLGLWVIILLGAAIWYLITQKGFKWPGAVATVFFGALLIFLMASFLMGKGLRSIGDTNRAYASGCAYAGLPCPGDVNSAKYAPDASSGGGGGGATIWDNNSSGSYNGGQGVVAEPQVTMRIRADALDKWVTEKIPNLRPASWLSKDIATTDLLPKGTTCLVTLRSNGSKLNEVWDWACNNSRGEFTSVQGVQFTTNGYIARDSRMFNANNTGKDGQEVFGTGDWRKCESCWDRIVATVPPTLPANTQEPNPGGIVVTETPPPATGATTYTGCTSDWADDYGYTKGQFPPGYAHSNGTDFCLNGSWIPASSFPAGVTPAALLAQYDAQYK